MNGPEQSGIRHDEIAFVHLPLDSGQRPPSLGQELVCIYGRAGWNRHRQGHARDSRVNARLVDHKPQR